MKLKDIVRESRETYKGDMSGIPVVGLEHLIPEEICFSEYEMCSDKTFTKAFHKGQVLFGRRRAYQKKAAVAHVDGVCSGDIMVLEAIPGKVEPSLLPFIIQNDRFFDYAIQHSEGGLSPRVKWNAIANYEFDLPSIKEQKVLADKLWAAYKVKESYRQLLSTTDEMLKDKFQEMFGDVVNSTIHNIAKVVSGKSIPTKLEDIVGPVAYVKVADFNLEGNEKYITTSSRFVTKENANLSKNVPIGSILFAKNGAAAMSNKKRLTKIDCCIDMNTLAVIPNKAKALPEFLLAFFESINIADHVRQGAIPSISPKDIENIALHLPPMELQQKFAEIATQAEATKTSLRASIEAIDRVIRSLINQ